MHKEYRPASRSALGLGERSLLAVALLALSAAVLQWLLWLQTEGPPIDTFVGPPRSDYELGPFTMQSYNAEGKFAFEVKSPRLVREPVSKAYDIDAPDIRMVDKDGNPWVATSHDGWISKDGRVIKLAGNVVADRLKSEKVQPVNIRTESIEADTDQNVMNSDDRVTVTQPGSILSGTGLDADLDKGVFVLRSAVKGRYQPSVDTAKGTLNMFHDRVFVAVILSLAAASAAHAGSEDRKQPVDVSADRQESDTKAGVTHLTGNVHIDQGSIKARSDTAVIYQADGNVSRAVLNGAPATIEQKLDSGEMMHGRAKQIDYDAAKSIALMTGDAVIEQPQGEMRGEHITYEITTGKVTADGQGKDGRVYMHLVPKTDEQKAAEKAGKDARKAADGDKPKQ